MRSNERLGCANGCVCVCGLGGSSYSRISFLSFSQGTFGVIVGVLFFALAVFNFFLIYRVRRSLPVACV